MKYQLNEILIPKSCEYRTGTENEPLEFFLEALSNSNQFDILLGYFSSTAINILSYGFAKFIANGGEARLIINHFLSKEDKEAIARGETHEPEVFYSHKPTFEEINKNLDERGVHFFNCLAWLVSKGKLNIRLIRPKGSGIAHYKSGIFRDGSSAIKFKGSCNFTATALIENLEELDIKCSWKSKEDISSIKDYEEYFENIYNKQSDFVEYLPIDKAIEVIRNNYGNKTLDELLIDEAELLKKKAKKYNQNVKLRKKLEKINKDLIRITNEPKFPFDSEPREYQVEAYENWVKNDFKGIFAMATGTGKTITALNCLLNLYQDKGQYLALILVPTKVLVNQWEKECKNFHFNKTILVSSQYPSWDKKLYQESEFLSNGIKRNFIIIATYQSFSKDKFQYILKSFPEDMSIICDEAHNLGSPILKKILPNIKFKNKIGLSATPKRNYDPQGTAVIEEFFEDKEPFSINYPIERAIDEGKLTQYDYFPIFINLTEPEFEEYQRITKQLMYHFDSDIGELKQNSEVEKLLLRRKRIIHKAENKKEGLLDAINELTQIKGNLKYTLIFAPEGIENDFASYESIQNTDEHRKLTNVYSRIVHNNFSDITTDVYESKRSNQDKVAILDEFEKGKIDALISMRCLDEGVDIPRTEAAVFCSSTGNPRQYIQRRGRILRTHNDKDKAYIFDLIVTPPSHSTENYDLERSLLLKEFERIAYFAFIAKNNLKALDKLKPIADDYDIDIYELKEHLKL